MLMHIKMPTIVGILTFMSWISFMLSWVEYEKSFITSGPRPVWTFIEDVCAYTMIRLTKILCAGPNYESIRTPPTVSYQSCTPLGQSINKYTAHLGKLNRSVLSFHARIQRGSRGSGSPGESHTMLRTKNEELFSNSRARTPPPPPPPQPGKNSWIYAWLCIRYL